MGIDLPRCADAQAQRRESASELSQLPRVRASRPGLAMKKTLFLHIGVHKTGSTSIQAFAQRQRDALARQGLHVVRAGQTPDGNHVSLAHALPRDPAAPRTTAPDLTAWHAAVDEIVGSPCGAALITSEEFTSVDAVGIATLAGLMSAAQIEVRVVVFLRDQLPALRSNHVELLKQGLIEHDFVSHLAMSAVDHDFVETIDRFNYQCLLQPWIEAFGRDRIEVEHYRPQQDAVRRFFTRIGLPRAVARGRAPVRLNTSPSDAVVSLLVLVNRYLSLCEGLTPERRTQIAYGLYEQASAELPAGQNAPACPASVRRMLGRHFEASNAWVARTFGVHVIVGRVARQDSTREAPTLPADEIERWLQRARAGVAYSLRLVQAPTAPPVVSAPGAVVPLHCPRDPAALGSPPPAHGSAHQGLPPARAGASPIPDPPPSPPLHGEQPPMSDDDTRVSDLWSDFATRRAAPGHLAWMFALDHPRIRNRIYARYLNGLDPMSYVRRLLPAVPVAAALEIGCGGGDLALAVRSMGIASHIDAFDVAAGAITLARTKARDAKVEGLNFFVADAGGLQLEASAYDFVYASHSLHHIEKLEGMFASVHRAMKPGTLFFANDYIGPSRMQYSDAHLELVNQLLASLPESKRVNKLANDTIKTRVERLPVETYLKIDPSEGVRAAEIVPVMRQYFDVEVIPTGMTLLYEVLLGIVHNFDPDDAQDNALIDLMLVADEMCSTYAAVEPCFACLVGRRKP